MKIEWTEDALQSYEMVLGYTAQNFGIQQVHKIRSIIEAKVASLLSFSSFGVHEYEWSEQTNADIRSIIVKHVIKIVYSVQDDTCIILAIWDVRRNPDDLLGIINGKM